jgi:hypothetical protein
VHQDHSANRLTILRTRRLPNRLYLTAVLGALVWTFGGSFLYWLRTGSATVLNGTLDPLTTILWFGPLLVISPFVTLVPLALIEPRGIFRAFYGEPTVVRLNQDELSWTMPNGVTGRAAWNDVGGVSSYGSAGGNSTQLFDLTGVEIAKFEGGFIGGDRQAVDLSAVALSLRPDLFEFVAEPSMAMVGCVRRQTDS